ncbi:MAG TPA: glycosyltransferase family 87 protein [Candidatus Dormibacteraeota bacterium]|nr:glycosyltransferase family 87 protein [Candidatus Dormibacteraeota bacterium]
MLNPHEFRAFGVNSWGPLIQFFRSRPRLWAVAGLWCGALLIAFNAYAAAVTYVPQFLVRNDFRLVYGAALVGWRDGYSHLYDLAAQQRVVESLGAYWSPYLNPPPLAWLGTAFLPLPFGVATVVWTALIACAALVAWWLAAPGAGLARWAHLALFMGLFPTAFGLMVGQPVALVAAAAAVAWWLAERKRPVLAGLALSAIALKPQLALLVPLCLLVAGQRRMFFGWLGPTVVMVGAAFLLLGADGLHRYFDALSLASQWEPTRRYAIAGPLGLGPQVSAVEMIVVFLACVASWRHRGEGATMPIAIGLVASLLFTPYVGFQDFAMLVVAGWLVIRAGATPFQVGLMVVGYGLLELALVVLAVPILLAEAVFLVSLAARPQLPASAVLGRPPSAQLPANAQNPE